MKLSTGQAAALGIVALLCAAGLFVYIVNTVGLYEPIPRPLGAALLLDIAVIFYCLVQCAGED